MPSGGSRARSGPAPDPRSGASDRKGLKFKSLPAKGYDGDAPEFPLKKQLRFYVYYEDKQRIREVDDAATDAFREAELEYWFWAWRTPQAALWATDQWAWVVPAVADWCRLKAMTTDPDCPTAIWTAIRQREGDILLSNDALLRAGYTVATDEVGERREQAAEPANRGGSRGRLKAVGDGR